jgi:hypothetical protein
MIRLLILLAVIAVAVPAQAGTGEQFTCDTACEAMIRDWVNADAVAYVPSLANEAERFESPAAQQACGAPRGDQPVVHAVVLAPFYRSFVELPGTQNDAKLLKGYFVDRGVPAELIRVADGDQVTRQRMIEVLTATLPCVRERDQVAVVFTGGATSYDRWLAPDFETFAAMLCEQERKDEAQHSFCEALGDMNDEARDAAVRTYLESLDGHSELVLFSSEVKIDLNDVRANENTLIEGLGATELANFVTQVRNRGADAFVLLDTNYAAGARLLSKSRDSVSDGGWYWDSGVDDEAPAQDVNDQLVPLFGGGNFAAFYATNEKQLARESPMGDEGLVLGQFIFTFAEVLRETPDIAMADLAAAITASMRENIPDQNPVFEASATDLRFLVTRAETPHAPDVIEIISPALKRGATAVEEKTFKLVARYTGTAKASKAIVDGDLVNIDGNGQFEKEIIDTGGKIEIAIRVVSKDLETLASSSLKLREKNAEEEIVTAPGRKVLLVIANEAYQDGGFAALKTPVADATAIAEVLTQKFGFVTKLEQGGKTADLFLMNATKAQIEQTLFALRRSLAADDQLLVFYAGHGENDPDLGAYWVPVDGVPGTDISWVSAYDITLELKRINARAVLVISDSCYAGGLSRGSGEVANTEARDRWLAKAARLKSRQLMASGGEEPVEDGGGGGHSVFAKALLDAFQNMPGRMFTASELFEQKVKPAVISAASATVEGQTPGFHRIARAGDEPGSEFIFVAAGQP